MAKFGKKYQEAAKLVEVDKLYEVAEALNLSKKLLLPSLTKPLKWL